MCLLLALAARAQAPAPTPGLPSDQDVVQFLNDTISWHGQLASQEQLANDPSDILYVNDSRQTSDEAVRQSFDFGRAIAQLLAHQAAPPTPEAQAGTAARYPSLAQAAAQADSEVRERQSQLQALQRALPDARGSRRTSLLGQIDAVQSELELEKTRSDTLRNILQFVSGSSSAGNGGLAAQIQELQRSVPDVDTTAAAPGPAPSRASAETTTAAVQTAQLRARPSGIVSLVSDLIALNRKLSVLRDGVNATNSLSQEARNLRNPLLAQLNTLAARGDDLVKQTAAAAPAESREQNRELDDLTASFKQVSNAIVPLGKQSILLGAYRANLERWRSTVKAQYSDELKSLLLRLAALGISLIVVIALSEIWRKAIFRYVHDVRRRYQFLLLRRIVLWIVIGIAVAFALASQIGSLATFVGLITAGIAVALQNVIMAIAGYFFLVGKYGVRVGDRVQIGGITGDVVDVGLVRLHLMEISGPDTGRQPTGRIVVFSNATVFQPGASFFKQIPGTNFLWHEVRLTMAPNADYRLAEKRALEAVEGVYAGYRQHIEEQHRTMQQTLNLAIDMPRPVIRLRFAQGGIELLIRYPTEIGAGAEIDDRVARALLDALETTPGLRLVSTGAANIQAVADAAPQQKAG